MKSNIEQDGVDEGVYGIRYIEKKETVFCYFSYKYAVRHRLLTSP
jgi:hypothetical protein